MEHLVKHRHYLVQTRTRIRTQIRSILAARNLDYKPLFSSKGEEYLASLTLRPAEHFRLKKLMSLLGHLDEQIKTAEKELQGFRKDAPEAEKKDHAIVKSVPGFGDLISDVVLSSLGDIRRFPSLKKATSYSGLPPGYRKSDKKKHELHMTKEGPRILRWALVQAAWRATMYSPYWKKVFERLANKRGKKIAIVAVARRLLGVIYSLLKSGTKYVENLAHPTKPARTVKGIMKV